MTQPYGTIKAQKFDIQGNSTAGEPNSNDWRLVVDNEQFKLKYYDSSNQTFSTLKTIDTSGNVTIPGNLQIVGDLDFASATMKGHIVPDTNDAYDIGSPEYKIRDIFVSESSLWIGDEHKVTISGGKMKFRKRKTTTVPAAILTETAKAANGSLTEAQTITAALANSSGISVISNMKLKHWKAYMRTLDGKQNAKVSDIFRATSDDYDEEQGADSWLESGNNIYLGASGNVGIGDSTPSYKLDVNGTFRATGNLTCDATITGNLTGNVTGNCSGTAATVTGVAQTSITSIGTLTTLQVDNININGNTISSTAGTDLKITPLTGQQIVLDDTIVIDAGVITGATSITSTSFVGALTGNCSGTAATVTGAAQPNITSVGTLTSLDVNGGVKIGTATGTANGTIQWTGSELQVRIGGTWERIAIFSELPISGLYAFTTFTFTNCGKTGIDGPTLVQCNASYTESWTDNTSYFNVTQTGYQIWTVPETASYTIDAYGARGGYNYTSNNDGGYGARMRGTFSLSEGDKYMILVGQMGGREPTNDTSDGSGGGGGTFIVKGTSYSGRSISDVLIVAGGGGGAPSDVHNGVAGGSGLANPNNTDTSGGLRDPDYHTGGGGGFNNNGQSSGYYPNVKGMAFTNGGRGGSYGKPGGFGGGAGTSNSHPGGGGGGYNGGNSDQDPGQNGGDGGGSRNNGTNQINTAGNNTGHGKVIITKL